MNRYLAGALAGLLATFPMTAVMQGLHRRLPPDERYPLPPREITGELARRAGVDDSLSEDERVAATHLLHYGYGAAAGALYPLLAPRGDPLVHGAAYGVAVWAASYLGWIPALRILRPATRHPARRNALMIAAHLVWGAATGAGARAWADGPAPPRSPSRLVS